jgi:4,5-DOPA dioxygenase extradiol
MRSFHADLMPAIFFGHGNPMNAISRNAYTEGWASIGESIPRPRAVLAVSAHWYIPACAVTANPEPRTTTILAAFRKSFMRSNIQHPAVPNLPSESEICFPLWW